MPRKITKLGWFLLGLLCTFLFGLTIYRMSDNLISNDTGLLCMLVFVVVGATAFDAALDL